MSMTGYTSSNGCSLSGAGLPGQLSRRRVRGSHVMSPHTCMTPCHDHDSPTFSRTGITARLLMSLRHERPKRLRGDIVREMCDG